MRTFRFPGSFYHSLAHIGLVSLFAICAGQLLAESDTNTVVGSLGKNFEQIRKRYQAETNNVELAWQFGRACYDMSTLQKDSSRQAEIAEEGAAACRAAATLKPNSVQAHYYLGMNIGQVADARHSLGGLRMVKEVEREFLAAQALDPHFDYGGPDRNLGLLYAGAPAIISIGSRSKARQHLEKAVEVAPDFPENRLRGIRWLGRGPYRVWQNRMQGTRLDVWNNAYNDSTPGESWIYPEFKGYFRDWQWADLQTADGSIIISTENKSSFLGLYQPKDGKDGLLDLPQIGIAFLDVIPAMRNKFHTTDEIGPQSKPRQVSGIKHGIIHFRFFDR